MAGGSTLGASFLAKGFRATAGARLRPIPAEFPCARASWIRCLWQTPSTLFRVFPIASAIWRADQPRSINLVRVSISTGCQVAPICSPYREGTKTRATQARTMQVDIHQRMPEAFRSGQWVVANRPSKLAPTIPPRQNATTFIGPSPISPEPDDCTLLAGLSKPS